MKDWTEAIKVKLLEDTSALPANELDFLEGMIRSRKRMRIVSLVSVTFVAAASVAIAIVLTSRGIEPTNNPSIVYAPEEYLGEVEEQSSSLPLETMSNKKTLPTKDIPYEELYSETVDIEDNYQPQTRLQDSLQTTNFERLDSTFIPEYIRDDSFGFPQTNRNQSSRRFSISLSTGGNMKSQEYYDAINLFGNNDSPNVETNTYQYLHHHPRIVAYELSFRYRLYDRLDLTSGICYYGTTSEAVRTSGNHSLISRTLLDQKASYMGVPLHLDWYPFKGRRFSMYVGAGGEARKCVYAKIGDERLKDNRIYYSAIALAGLKYEPIKHIGLFIEPQYSYSFLPENPAVRSALTEYPSSFSLKLGLSFEL